MLMNDSEPTPKRLTYTQKTNKQTNKKTVIEIPQKADIGCSVTGVKSVLASLVKQFYRYQDIMISCYPQIPVIKQKNNFDVCSCLRKCQISVTLTTTIYYRHTISLLGNSSRLQQGH